MTMDRMAATYTPPLPLPIPGIHRDLCGYTGQVPPPSGHSATMPKWGTKIWGSTLGPG